MLYMVSSHSPYRLLRGIRDETTWQIKYGCEFYQLERVWSDPYEDHLPLPLRPTKRRSLNLAT